MNWKYSLFICTWIKGLFIFKHAETERFFAYPQSQPSILEIDFKSKKMESIHLFSSYLLSTVDISHQSESQRFDDEQNQHGP